MHLYNISQLILKFLKEWSVCSGHSVAASATAFATCFTYWTVKIGNYSKVFFENSSSHFQMLQQKRCIFWHWGKEYLFFFLYICMLLCYSSYFSHIYCKLTNILKICIFKMIKVSFLLGGKKKINSILPCSDSNSFSM